jgi:FkbM family methyltransferase
MSAFSWMYDQASKGFNNEPVRKLKDALRPVKHALVGKQGIYQAIAVAKSLQARRGKDISAAFDIGGAIGEAAIPMAKGFPNAQVYSFEPFPDSFEKLDARTKKFRDRIHVFDYGLSNTDAELTFYGKETQADVSSLIKPKSLEGYRIIKAQMRTLDAVCAELGIEHIDFMKVDVEGMEKEMFQGAQHMLRNTDNIFVEISPYLKGFNRDYIDTFEMLYHAGLQLYGVYGDFFFTRWDL